MHPENSIIMAFLVRNGGVRRYQNPDGTLTEEGRKRYSVANGRGESRYVVTRKFGQDGNKEDFVERKMAGIKYKKFDKLMSAEQVEKSGKGSCHDQVMLEYRDLKRAGFSPKIKFFIETNDKGEGGTTHSLVYFIKNGKTYWIENAWGSQKGKHEYENYDALIKDVKSKWEKNSKYPELYSGDINYSDLEPGMTLQDIIDVVDFD